MEKIATPNVQVDHPDRHLICQHSIEAAFQSVIDQAVMAGWGEEEVTSALVDLADNHMLSMIVDGRTSAVLTILRRMT